MIIEFDRSLPTTDEKLKSLKESVQLAFYKAHDEVEALRKIVEIQGKQIEALRNQINQ